MADPLITAQDIIDRLDGGEEELRRLAGDDGTGSYSADKVTAAIAEASEAAYGILKAGFQTNARVKLLVDADADAKTQIVHMVRHALTQFKNDFRMNGEPPFAGDARRARDILRQKASFALRTSAEIGRAHV